MSIINELNAGSTEYKDGGIQIQHPPTSLALRAARHIQELENSLVGLRNAHDMLAVTNEQYFALIDQLQKDLEHERNHNRPKTADGTQNVPLRDDAGREDKTIEASEVGNDDGAPGLPGSDQSSEKSP